MFEVVEGVVTTRWYPVDGTDTLYEGQIVQYRSDGTGADGTGLEPLGVAAGAWDTTGKNMPWGIVVGASNRTPVYDTTWRNNSITQVSSQADLAARENAFVEGMFIKGDPQAYVKVAVIGPNSVIRGPLYNNAYGTALTVNTVSTGSSTGLGCTTDAISFTPVATLATMYCRSGANAGVYRDITTTSTTIHTWVRAMPQDIAVGDTMVAVPMKLGLSQCQFDAESMYIDASLAPVAAGTARYQINVHYMNLEQSGNEYIEFCFGHTHFLPFSTRP